MTGKDLLEGLNFVDDDLIEEAGKEILSAETTEEKKQSAEEEKRSAELAEEKKQSAEEEKRSAELAEEKKISAELVETKMQSKSGKRSSKHSGKVVFLRAAVSVAAGLLIFVAGTAVGSHKAVKPLRGVPSAYMADGETQEYTEEYTEIYTETCAEGIELLGAYPEEESQSALNEGEAEAMPMPQEERGEAQSVEIPVQEGMVGAVAENAGTLSLSADIKVGKKIESSQIQQVQAGHLPQLPATVIGGVSVYFYQKDDAENSTQNSTENSFFADFEQNNVSYTLQADTLREVVQAAADVICGTGVVTVVE